MHITLCVGQLCHLAHTYVLRTFNISVKVVNFTLVLFFVLDLHSFFTTEDMKVFLLLLFVYCCQAVGQPSTSMVMLEKAAKEKV